jgi:hypothetical protein
MKYRRKSSGRQEAVRPIPAHLCKSTQAGVSAGQRLFAGQTLYQSMYRFIA